MQTIILITSALAELAALIGVVVKVIGSIKKLGEDNKKLAEGNMCLLRSQMLHTYYTCKDIRKIRQYERENFERLYASYKLQGGNSFIDDIHNEIRSYEIIT